MRYVGDYHYYPPHMLRRTYVAALRQGQVIICGICIDAIKWRDKRGRLTIDHIVPRSCGGSDDYPNLQPAHARCNEAKGNNEPLITFDTWPPSARPLSLQSLNA